MSKQRESSRHQVAVIADVIGSRTLPDRELSHQQLLAAAKQVNGLVPAVHDLAPTVGDELQALYPDAASALLATLALRLWLPSSLECRFGLGVGTSRTISNVPHDIRDGSAWWTARAAIEVAQAKQARRNPPIRTWYRVDEAARDDAGFPDEDLTNAYVTARDYIVGKMRDGTRALLLGALRGQTQVETAQELGITQGTVSSGMRTSGPSIVLQGVELMDARWRR